MLLDYSERLTSLEPELRQRSGHQRPLRAATGNPLTMLVQRLVKKGIILLLMATLWVHA